MRRLIALCLALTLPVTLMACAKPEPMAEAVIDDGVVVDEAPMAAPEATKCGPGEGDGIGGTGCAID